MKNNNLNLTQYQKEVLIGLMLSDGHISKRSLSNNTMFMVTFSKKFETFALHVKNIFNLFIGFFFL